MYQRISIKLTFEFQRTITEISQVLKTVYWVKTVIGYRATPQRYSRNDLTSIVQKHRMLQPLSYIFHQSSIVFEFFSIQKVWLLSRHSLTQLSNREAARSRTKRDRSPKTNRWTRGMGGWTEATASKLRQRQYKSWEGRAGLEVVNIIC